MRILRLNRFRITTRVYAGFACLILLGLTIAVFGLSQLNSVERASSMVATFGERTANNLSNMLNLQVMRRTAAEYHAFGDKAAAAQFAEAHKATTAWLEVAQRETT